MARLRKSITLVVTVGLAIAAVASLALALLTVVDDLRRPPSIGSPAVARVKDALWLYGDESLFVCLPIGGEIWDATEWSCRASARNGGISLIWMGKRCQCGELRPKHIPSCIVGAGLARHNLPVSNEVMGVEWHKGLIGGSGYASLSISYWTLVALFAPFPLFRAFRWYRQRRRPGFCACGYDLTGNVSGICPECGAALNARSADERPTI
ncbi:MAG: hypothetical protein AMXMBFR47_33540 [Planctomycetota bacterium]